MRKSAIERIFIWFGSEKNAEQQYKEKTAEEIWREIPEEKKDVKFHAFQNFLTRWFKKVEHGGARPGSGNRREKRK